MPWRYLKLFNDLSCVDKRQHRQTDTTQNNPPRCAIAMQVIIKKQSMKHIVSIASAATHQMYTKE